MAFCVLQIVTGHRLSVNRIQHAQVVVVERCFCEDETVLLLPGRLQLSSVSQCGGRRLRAVQNCAHRQIVRISNEVWFASQGSPESDGIGRLRCGVSLGHVV